MPRRPADVGFTLSSAILIYLGKVEFLAVFKAYISFTPVAAASFKAPKALWLTFLVEYLYGLDLYIKEHFYCRFDLRLGSIQCHVENDLLIVLCYNRCLFCHDCSQDDLISAFYVHPKTSSIWAMAGLVINTFS